MEENKNISVDSEESVKEAVESVTEENGVEENFDEFPKEAFDEAADDTEKANKPEYVPKNKYENTLYKVYCDDGLSEILRISSLAIVAVTVYAFFAHILKLIEVSPLLAVEILLITGVPFLAVSVMRKMINAPRPYELLEFYEKKPKDKKGSSFPSRHVFSVFVIATVIVPTNIALGIGLFALGAALGLIRVILGVHFIRDVVAGALIGVISGAVGLLTLTLI